MAQLLESSKSKNGKVLNALNFPLPLKSVEPTTFSSDAHAMHHTLNDVGWRHGMAPPTGDIRWGVASTKGAWHGWHIDSDGNGTFIIVIYGAKWWIVARPTTVGGSKWDFRQFANIDFLMNDLFDPDKPCSGLWTLEAILLVPGTEMYMRPNTIHAVYTPKPTVVEGGHFLATSTMQDTMFGLIHSFVGDRFVTNTAHAASRFILRQMISFYHSALVKGTVEEEGEPFVGFR